MKISPKIWNELGELAQYVDFIDHNSGAVFFRENVSQENKDAVEKIIRAHKQSHFISPEQNVAAIKAKARHLILTRVPEYKQRNYLARKLELQDKLIMGQSLTLEEQAELNFITAEWQWIKAVRETSNAAEAAGIPVDEVIWPE